MKNFLNQIRSKILERVDHIPKLEHSPRSFLPLDAIFRKSERAIIAEIKFSSPSHGRIYSGPLSLLEIADSYLSNGAHALSMLTEPFYFGGHIEWIREVKATYPQAPILLKDFILDVRQIEQAALYGADAVLLIAAFLEPAQLQLLYQACLDQGLTPLIEIHSLAELEAVLPLAPKILGINHRNLSTLEIDFRTSIELLPHIPNEIYVIAESGMQTAVEMRSLSKAGIDGFLIGSALMKNPNPGLALKKLLRGYEHES